MPLAKCHTCGKEVAVNAKTCPHCGADDPAPSKGKGVFQGILGLVLLAALLVGGYFGIKHLVSGPSEHDQGKSMGVAIVKELRENNDFEALKKIKTALDEAGTLPFKHPDKSAEWNQGFREGVKQEFNRK
jgi:hypothetical protein